jgi:hypothetical protein
LLVITVISCGKISKQIKEEIGTITEAKLSEKQQSFCENFFIAIQVQKIINNDKWSFDKIDSDDKFRAVTALLGFIKSKGYDDVIHAFAIPSEYDYEQKKVYSQSVLQDLGLDTNQSFQSGNPDDILGFLNMNMNGIFQLVYSKGVNSRLKSPELKTTFVEKLDNDNEIWLVQDYQSMKQARLIVQKDGGLNIGNLTNIETVITH